MNPFARQTELPHHAEDDRRARVLDRARKNLKSYRRWGRCLAATRIVILVSFILVLAGISRTLFQFMMASSTSLDRLFFICTTGMCGMLGFKTGFYMQTFMGQLLDPTTDEMLVEYHDKLKHAGLL